MVKSRNIWLWAVWVFGLGAYAQTCDPNLYILSGDSGLGTTNNFSAQGGTTQVRINVPGGCSWDTANIPTWVNVTPPSGTNTQVVTISVAVNASLNARGHSILIGGRNFPINQAGALNGPATGDFNADGHSDVLWQAPTNGFAQVWALGGSNGVSVLSAANLTLQNPWRIVATGDFDNDGRVDVLWQDPVTGVPQIWYMGGTAGTQVVSAKNLSGPNPWHIAGTGDFNRDGRVDIIWQSPTNGYSQVWFLGGTDGTTVLNSVNLSQPNPWRIAATGDINGDGYTDLVWQDPATGASQVWFLGGTNGVQIMSAANVTGPTAWKIVGAADYNRDGNTDIVVQDTATGASQVWFLGGTSGVTILSTATLSGANPWTIVGPR